MQASTQEPRETREEYHPDLVRWNAILAGTVAAIGILVASIVLGGAFRLGSTTSWGIWGGVTLIIALFVGGWLAARTSAPGGTFSGLVDGSVVWATTLIALLFVVTAALSTPLAQGMISSLVGRVFLNALLQQLNPFAEPAAPTAANVALWSFVGLVLSYIAAVLGGWFGASQEESLALRR